MPADKTPTANTNLNTFMKDPDSMLSPILGEAQLNAILDHMVDVVVQVDSQGVIQYVTPSAERKLGYDTKAVLGKSAFDFIHQEDRDASVAAFQDALHAGVGKKVEVRVRHQDENHVWMELLGDPIADDAGNVGVVLVCREITDRKLMEEEIRRLYGVLEDRVLERTAQLESAKKDLEIQVTGHKRAEEILRESEKKYRELVDLLPLSVFEVDQELNILSGNPAIYETFGYTQEDLEKGLNAFSMIVPEDRGKIGATIQKLMRREKTGGTQFTGIRKDGSTFPMAIFASSVMQGDKPVGLRGAIIDLTRQKQAEKDLHKARDLLVQSEKLVSIGRLSTGVAHEILNPIDIISIELQMLRGMRVLPPEVLEDLDICMDQVQRIVRIAEGLKQLARTPTKAATKNDINKVIVDLLTLYSPQLKLQGVEVDVQCQPDLPQISIHRERIEQVILNLITNAVAAMENKERKVLRVITRKNHQDLNNYLRIMVADTGEGIKKENLSKLFDPFFTTKEYGKGTGLGLFISYGIIQDHGGRIWGENNEWGGATFFIDLPVNAEKAIPAPEDRRLDAEEKKTACESNRWPSDQVHRT